MSTENSFPLQNTPGARLREARESKGISVEEAADKLRLSKQQIIALENNEFERLTGSKTYIRGYLRMYARLVGASANEIIKAFDELGMNEKELSQKSPLILTRPQKALTEETYSHSTRWWSYGLIIIVIAVLVYAWFNHIRHQVKLEKDNSVAAPALAKPQPTPEAAITPTPLSTPATATPLPLILPPVKDMPDGGKPIIPVNPPPRMPQAVDTSRE